MVRMVVIYHMGPWTADSMDLVKDVQLVAGLSYFISMGFIVSECRWQRREWSGGLDPWGSPSDY